MPINGIDRHFLKLAEREGLTRSQSKAFALSPFGPRADALR